MRVAITGMDAFTPIGNGRQAIADGLRAGRGGARPISIFDAGRHRARTAAEVDWQKPAGSLLSRATEMVRAVTRSALDDAGLRPGEAGPLRVGVVLASNQGGMPPSALRYREVVPPYRPGDAARRLRERILDGAPSATLDQLMVDVGACGPAVNISTACSAGLHALGLADSWVRSGAADVVVVCATEVLTEPALAGFSVLRALTQHDEPRPFDRDRDGTMLGEGAAALVVEDAGRAAARGVAAWAEIVGYGSSTDASHPTRPEPEGPARAMREALGTFPLEAVGWVKAHGTATPANDAAEARAIRMVFGARISRLPITSLKAAVGHSLGASGAVESVLTVLALNGGYVPQTRGVRIPDPECAMDVVMETARAVEAEMVLANAFGFGGNNASLLFRRTASGRRGLRRG